jgi:hypothetical protein
MIQSKSDNPIFITGIERSGSSIIARIVNHCGAFSGRTSEMYENLEIGKLLDSYYNLLGFDKKGQNPLPDTMKLIIPTNWRQKVMYILSDEKCEKERIWMFKDSRLCQTWPMWHYAFPNAKWVIVRRRTGDIIDSCMKTGWMVAYSTQDDWLQWIHLHEKLFVEMMNAGVNCRQVWPERMVTGDYKQMEKTIEWLGLDWSDDIIDIITPLMWNSKQNKRKG